MANLSKVMRFFTSAGTANPTQLNLLKQIAPNKAAGETYRNIILPQQMQHSHMTTLSWTPQGNLKLTYLDDERNLKEFINGTKELRKTNGSYHKARFLINPNTGEYKCVYRGKRANGNQMYNPFDYQQNAIEDPIADLGDIANPWNYDKYSKVGPMVKTKTTDGKLVVEKIRDGQGSLKPVFDYFSK